MTRRERITRTLFFADELNGSIKTFWPEHYERIMKLNEGSSEAMESLCADVKLFLALGSSLKLSLHKAEYIKSQEGIKLLDTTRESYKNVCESLEINGNGIKNAFSALMLSVEAAKNK